MLFARPVTLCSSSLSPGPLSARPGHLASHMEGLAELLSAMRLPLNTLFVPVSHREWTIVRHPKGDLDKIFSVSVLVMFNQSPRQIYEV